MQVFELADFTRLFSDRNYGDAKDLYLSKVNRPPLFDVGFEDAPIIEQLQLLAEIQAWLENVRQQQQDAIVPPIRNLKGTFDGEVKVSGSLNTGLTSEFDFLGQQWRWGNLVGEKIIARGSLKEGILTLLPISLQLRDTSKPDRDRC